MDKWREIDRDKYIDIERLIDGPKERFSLTESCKKFWCQDCSLVFRLIDRWIDR